MSHGSADDLTLLGASKMDYPTDPDDCDLQAIPWEGTPGSTTVTLHCPEFTALCPKTGQPDFGKLVIEYSPREKIVESKALKLYLFAFREHGAFHEVTVHKICKDLFTVLEPEWLEVRGEYMPRGGISIWPACKMSQ